MTKKIFRSMILVAVVVLLCSLGIILSALYSYFSDIQMAQLKDELSLAVIGTEQYGNAFLENVESDRFRITWIDADGTVLFDTRVAAGEMENHSGREEITEALAKGTGTSSRFSDTLMEKTYYEARRLRDGTVLRVSGSQASVGGLVVDMFPSIGVMTVIVVLLSLFLANRMSRKIVEPLNSLDLEHPLENDTYEEISPLLQRINRQHLQISDQMHKLRRKNDEFDQITANMQEGLVVMDKETRIRSINPTALRLLQADKTCLGSSFLTLDRGAALRQTLNDALDRGHGTAVVALEGREYRVDMSSIRSEGKLLGAVALIFDVTEELNAERSRREFSANVSHELKTPLQSIIGSAELLESGLVKPEDTPRFMGHIRREAARLVDLVEDIIRLSQLDEGVNIPTERVELLEVVNETAAILESAARERNITLEVSGEGFTVEGNRRLLFEIVYNLCDNAVKYNVPGGSVRVTVEDSCITVADTGIGITKEHQGRVFERFYRVDKSHSKQSGGTGLGLSIVKHAVAYHNANLGLESVPGKGTTVTVRFQP